VANTSSRSRAKLVRAAGGILWRDEANGPRLAVIHRPRQDDWSLPKGKLEDGESFPQAAVREVREETGCRARLGDFAGYALYQVKGRPKLVLFWHMAAEGAGRFRPNDEVDRLEWLAPAEALARLDRPAERQIVEIAVAERLARHRGASTGRSGSPLALARCGSASGPLPG